MFPIADVILALSLILAKHGDGPPVFGVLFGGIFFAVIGMGIYLRWTAHREEKKKQP
ncbi:MAG: hypothetical protein ACRD0C_14740 [Acidimicrobiia bacterium]